MELIGLDLGQKRTGIARASSLAKLAEPLESVETQKLVQYLQKLKDIQAIVIGLPRNLDGDDTAQTRWAREFVQNLKTEVNAKMYWQDEALTSALSTTSKSKVHDDHSHAAKIILQDWIDTPVEDRVLC
jgi:putative Holliday junction resolvase